MYSNGRQQAVTYPPTQSSTSQVWPPRGLLEQRNAIQRELNAAKAIRDEIGYRVAQDHPHLDSWRPSHLGPGPRDVLAGNSAVQSTRTGEPWPSSAGTGVAATTNPGRRSPSVRAVTSSGAHSADGDALEPPRRLPAVSSRLHRIWLNSTEAISPGPPVIAAVTPDNVNFWGDESDPPRWFEYDDDDAT